MIGIFDPISDFSKRNAPIDYQSQKSLTSSFVYRGKKKSCFRFVTLFLLYHKNNVVKLFNGAASRSLRLLK